MQLFALKMGLDLFEQENQKDLVYESLYKLIEQMKIFEFKESIIQKSDDVVTNPDLLTFEEHEESCIGELNIVAKKKYQDLTKDTRYSESERALFKKAIEKYKKRVDRLGPESINERKKN